MRALAGILTYPPLCIICGLLLLLDWTSLPRTPAASSTAARYCPFTPAWRGAMHGRTVPVELWRTPNGLAVTFAASGRPPVPDDWQGIYEFSLFRDLVRSRGFWGMTSATERIQIFGDQSLTQAEHAQLIPTLVRAFDAEPDWQAADPLTYSLLKSGGTTRTHVLFKGYVHNAIAIMLASLFLAGLPRTVAAIPSAVAQWPRERREDRRLSRGLCPTCAYDLRADFESGCPECGWNRREEPNGRGAP